jgi:PTS system mannose-specific IIB component
MGLLLLRVDDRLIHGQVTQGWGSVLQPDRYVVVNDSAASSEWERELYEGSAPDGTRITVLGVDAAAAGLQSWLDSEEDIIILVESPGDALRLYEKGLEFERLNVGGLHFKEGRRRILPFVCVGEDDIEAFRALQALGVEIECADVPGSERKDLFKWLGSAASGN